jgi:hypothetical protein
MEILFLAGAIAIALYVSISKFTSDYPNPKSLATAARRRERESRRRSRQFARR